MRGLFPWAAALVCSLAAGAWCIPPPSWAEKTPAISHTQLQSIALPAAPQTLTLQDALQLGFANNSGFRSQISSLLQSEANLRVVRQLYSLTLSASTEKDQQTGEEDVTRTSAGASLGVDLVAGGAISVTAALDRLDSEEARSLGLTLTQPLLQGAGFAAPRHEAIRSAYNGYRRALLSYFLARQDLALGIITGYFGVVQAKQQVAIQEQGLAQTDRAVKDAEARLAEGMTTKIEVTRAQLSQASGRLALNTAKLAYLDQMDAFLQTLGLQVGSVPALATQPVHRPMALDTESLVQEGLANRAELRIEDLSLEDTRAALSIARNSRLPALDLFGASNRLSDGGSSREWTLGLRTSIPIGSRALTEAVRSAERGWWLAERGREELRQHVAIEVRDRARGLQSQQERIDILEQSLQVAREKLRLANISVEEGIGVYRDKIEAQDEVTAAEGALLDAQIQYYFGVLNLRRSVGRDVLEELGKETIGAAETSAQPPTPNPSPEGVSPANGTPAGDAGVSPVGDKSAAPAAVP